MKTRKILGFLLLLASALSLSACVATGPTRDINDPANSLIFGYIDMDDAPTDLEYAHVKQVFPSTEYPYWQLGVEDGVLYSGLLAPGGYQMSNFGGSSFLGGPVEYSFPNYGRNQTAVRIDSPGIYFIGAFKYEEVDTGFLEADKFSMAPISSPGERELLERIAKMDWVKGTQWEERIRARLEELRK